METQKIVNLLNGSDNENSKFTTKNGTLLIMNQKVIIHTIIHNPVKCLTNSIESNLRDYSDAYILVTGKIVTGGDNSTKVVFKNYAPFKDCRTEINDTFADYADFINITTPMYYLIEYSDNYSDNSGSL